MSTRSDRDTGTIVTDCQQVLVSKANCRKALPVQLDVVRGPKRLPADPQSQEVLTGRLRVLQVDSVEVAAVFTELCGHVLSINSEDRVILVTFHTFEEIWKFTTYYTMGLLAQLMQNLLFDENVWLKSVGEDVAVEASVQEDTLHLIYKGLLMQEGSMFARCKANQMFDSCTSGGDLYLEQGDVAQFEPPFLGSGWTVRCLPDGARGTAPKAALDLVDPFHQWCLKSCEEDVLVGDGKPACDFPLHFARGTCVATVEYEAEGLDELSLAPGDKIIITGLLVSCFDWFTGRKRSTGQLGLVRTSLVKPSTDTHSSVEILADAEDGMFFSVQDDKVLQETTALLKKKCKNDTGQKYKLDVISYQEEKSLVSSREADAQQADLKRNILSLLHQGGNTSQGSPENLSGFLEESGESGAAEEPRPPSFSIHSAGEGDHTENFSPLFSFLEGGDYKAEFGCLYRTSWELLASSTFPSHSEDELVALLGVARETARKKRLLWCQSRLCFLLGKLCARRSNFSQARVYFEEALSVPCEGFSDLRLLASIYSNLAAIYLLQQHTKRFFVMAERLAALLLGIPECLASLEDNTVLKYILKKAVLSHNNMAEAQACYLLAKHYWTHTERPRAVPYLERFLVLYAQRQTTGSLSLSRGYLTLGRLYGDLGLPHLTIGSARRASLLPAATLSDCLSSMALVLDVDSLTGNRESSVPPHVAPFLHQALSLTENKDGRQYRVMSLQLTLCLCQIFDKHKMVEHAIIQMHNLINNCAQQVSVSATERNAALMWLAWLHIHNKQPSVAVDILDLVLLTLPQHCTTPQEGALLNMRGVALRCLGDFQGAAQSYRTAVDVCLEFDDLSNCAVAQANLGLLFVKAGDGELALRHLTEAVQVFSELDDDSHEANFITVLLELGQVHVTHQQLGYGKGCYEWALLVAIKANLLPCQLAATQKLSHLYTAESPDQAQRIIYSQHQVQMLRRSGDREQEGDALEAISQLYLTLATERAYRAALDHTKSSLAIFIDVGCREKEAYGWLQAGKIYQLLGQTELVDLYIQVAQDVALSTGDTRFTLELLEAAGDIFFNSFQDRDKAITFYRDRALPIAVKSRCLHTRLRLCNKLTEVMLNLQLYGEALEFAKTALELSMAQEEPLKQRVACHRLAAVFHRLHQHELAEHFYLKTLSLCPSPLEFDEETLYYVGIYQTLGDIIFYNLKDPFDAAGYYHLALAAAMDLGNKRSQLQLCTRLATIYHNFLLDRELSLFFYQRARGFAAELNVKRVNIGLTQLHVKQ